MFLKHLFFDLSKKIFKISPALSTQHFDFALHEREHRLPNFTRALNHWLKDISHTLKIFKTLDFKHINHLVLNKESIGIKYRYLILFCYSFNSIICLTFTWYICLENVEWIVDFFSRKINLIIIKNENLFEKFVSRSLFSFLDYLWINFFQIISPTNSGKKFNEIWGQIDSRRKFRGSIIPLKCVVIVMKAFLSQIRNNTFSILINKFQNFYSDKNKKVILLEILHAWD